jgi:hypothetical protein
METILLNVLIFLIVAAALIAIVKVIPDSWVDPWLKQVFMIVVVAILLIGLILYIIIPLLHIAGAGVGVR